MKEGLAQFYTKVVAEKLSARSLAVLGAYERLLELQTGPYRRSQEVAGKGTGEARRDGTLCPTSGADNGCRDGGQVEHHPDSNERAS